MKPSDLLPAPQLLTWHGPYRNRHNIRVITNAVNIAMELSNCEGLRTFVTGGFVQWAGSFSLTGHGAINFLKDMDMDKVFVSVCGLDAARGLTLIESEGGADISRHDSTGQKDNRGC
jgi:DeoR/GlpR family transcriptional regulator of sugar metabolism